MHIKFLCIFLPRRLARVYMFFSLSLSLCMSMGFMTWICVPADRQRVSVRCSILVLSTAGSCLRRTEKKATENSFPFYPVWAVGCEMRLIACHIATGFRNDVIIWFQCRRPLSDVEEPTMTCPIGLDPVIVLLFSLFADDGSGTLITVKRT